MILNKEQKKKINKSFKATNLKALRNRKMETNNGPVNERVRQQI
jgi:hypothetical protein